MLQVAIHKWPENFFCTCLIPSVGQHTLAVTTILQCEWQENVSYLFAQKKLSNKVILDSGARIRAKQCMLQHIHNVNEILLYLIIGPAFNKVSCILEIVLQLQMSLFIHHMSYQLQQLEENEKQKNSKPSVADVLNQSTVQWASFRCLVLDMW